MTIIIIITSPKPAYGQQGLAGGSLRADTELGCDDLSWQTDKQCIIIYIPSSSLSSKKVKRALGKSSSSVNSSRLACPSLALMRISFLTRIYSIHENTNTNKKSHVSSIHTITMTFALTSQLMPKAQKSEDKLERELLDLWNITISKSKFLWSLESIFAWRLCGVQ